MLRKEGSRWLDWVAGEAVADRLFPEGVSGRQARAIGNGNHAGGSVSIGSVAVDLAQQIFGNIADAKIMRVAVLRWLSMQATESTASSYPPRIGSPTKS